MPRKLKPGDKVGKYTIKKEMNIGAMAIAYEALDASGEQVFLKLYKSPTVTKDWYRDYVKYQKTLKQRIESTTAKGFTYRFIDFFEHAIGAGSPVYFQVFEFVKGGDNLEEILKQVKQNRTGLTWDQRLIMAKVFIAGIHHLHKAKIVHCDLKPANVQLFKDPHITAGYRLKIIDMDFSVLPDIKAPWHGDEGYVGTPNYFSPEHLAKGQVPGSHSDVFTCGLILYELLAKTHPYAGEDEEDYKRKALRGCPPPPVFDDAPPGGLTENVAAIIASCLCPKPVDRPSAEDVLLVLNGRKTAAEVGGAEAPAPTGGPTPKPAPVPVSPTSSSRPPVPSSPSSAAPSPPPSHPPISTPAAPLLSKLTLKHGDVSLVISITTPVGKHLVEQFGEESRFFDNLQFTLERLGDEWFVEPSLIASNETLLNGDLLDEKQPVLSGDVLSVGRSAKKISKLPLSIEIA